MSGYLKIRQILDVDPAENRCVGFAPSQGRRCKCSLNQGNRNTAERILNEMERSRSISSISSDSLRKLASVTLCKHYHNSDLQSRAHHNQVDEVCRKWRRTLKEYSRTTEEERVRSELLKSKMELGKIRKEAEILIASIDKTEVTTAIKHTDPQTTERSSLDWIEERSRISVKANTDVEDPFVESTILNISKQNPLSLDIRSGKASSVTDINSCVRKISHDTTETLTTTEDCSESMGARQTYVLPSPPNTRLILSAQEPEEIQDKSWLNISQPTTPIDAIIVHSSFARKINNPLKYGSRQNFSTKPFRFDSPMQLGLSSEAEYFPSTPTAESNLVQASLPALEPALTSTPLKPSPKSFVSTPTCKTSQSAVIDIGAQDEVPSRTDDFDLPCTPSFAITEAYFLGSESGVTDLENLDHKEEKAIMPESINDNEEAGDLLASAAPAAPKTVVNPTSVLEQRLITTETLTLTRPLTPIKTTPVHLEAETPSESTPLDRPHTPIRTPEEDLNFGYAVITSSTRSKTYLSATYQHGLITPPETPEARVSVISDLRIETIQFATSLGEYDRPPFAIARKPLSSIPARKPVARNSQNETQQSEVVMPEKCAGCGCRNIGEGETCGCGEESGGEPGTGCLRGFGFRRLRKRVVRKVGMVRTRISAARVKSEEEENKGECSFSP